ncbi:MAG: hypothetical protein PWQ68_1932 [Thermoanaerobacteraceae bacterium]|nr:hypothetical protein [Thermoanaerobacteraceae bacterium]
MATPVKMPKIGLSDESAIIAKWYKKKGEQVKAGEVLFAIETDKSTFDVEAEVDGTLLDVFFNEGDEVPVLTDVGVIGSEGEDISSITTGQGKPESQAATQKLQIPEAESIKPEVSSKETVEKAYPDLAEAEENGIIKISPRARNLAERAGVDFRFTSPTGPEGRIIERDILALIEKGPVFTPAAKEEYLKSGLDLQVSEGTGVGGRITTGDLQKNSEEQKVEKEASMAAKGLEKQETVQKSVIEGPQQALQYKEVKFTNIRKVIARNMMNSLSTTAQLTHHATFDATEILAYREKIKAAGEKYGLENITLNDMVLYAVSRTLLNHPDLNAHLVGETMMVFENLHLGVAIDTERGLMVPTIFNANLKSLNEISREVKELAEQCRKGSINPDYLKGGTFTVTNLGPLDVEHFTPILNPPQTGILGVCSITYKPRLVNGQYEYYPAMGLSLTFDHRAVDGAPAARFLKDLKTNLENFSLLLAR